MPVKTFRPITPSRRQMTVDTFEEITVSKPERSLVVRLKKKCGPEQLRKNNCKTSRGWYIPVIPHY